MKTPSDLNGSELVKRLGRFGYIISHQTGSHIIVRTQQNGEHTLSVPNHKPLRVGTLSSILNDVAEHFGLSKAEITQRVLGKK
ncbi:type II toxin-antitoxin system HicA family toxin [Persicitalea sp.]|uniref:type II toxin-antitoxin system HicA family toxin n=1 Tax=Persicitalea sp. TaxID=3100273 RepID=UPI0035946619